MNAMLLSLSLIFALLPLYVVSAPPVPYLVITTSEFVYRMNLDDTDHKEVVILPPGGRDVDYHFRRRKLYWGHESEGSAGRANLDDGTDRTTVPTLRSELAVDWRQNKIYYSTPNTLKVYDIDSGMNDELPVSPDTPGPYYDLSVDPNIMKLYYVDDSDSQLHEYNLVTEKEKTRPLECPARYLSHIESNKLFYSCPSDGVYRFTLETPHPLVYDDIANGPFGDVTSYINKVFWAQGACIYSKQVGEDDVAELDCFSETIQGLTVVHPSLQR